MSEERPADGGRDDFSAHLAELRRAYLKSLPGKLCDLRALVASLEGGSHGGTLEELRSAVHRIKGSAGTYGLAAASEVASRWEAKIDALLAAADHPTESDLLEMRAHLSLLESAVTPGAEGEADGAMPLPAGAGAGGVRVLLVEDDDDLAPLLLATLSALGFETERARDVPSALQLFRASPPEVLVTDYFLPGGDAPALMGEIRREDPDLPVLLISASAGTAELGRMFRESVHEFLPKPINPRDLRRTLLNLRDLSERRKRERDQVPALLGTTVRLHAGMAPEEIMGACIPMVGRLTPFRSAEILKVGAAGQGMEVAASLGEASRLPPAPSLDFLRSLPAAGLPSGTASFVHGESLMAAAPPEGGGYDVARAKRESWGPGDCVIVELVLGAEAAAFLRAGDPSDGMRPTREAMEVLSLLGQMMASLVRDSVRQRFETRVLDRLEATSDLLRYALHSSEPDVVLDLVTQSLFSRFGFSSAIFALWLGEGIGWSVVKMASREGAAGGGGPSLTREALGRLDEVRERDHPVFHSGPPGAASYVGRPGCLCSLALPVCWIDTVFYALILERDEGQELEITEANILISVADQVRLILKNLHNQASLERARSELEASKARTEASYNEVLRLQEVLRHYLPASTWESVRRSGAQEAPQYIESLSDRAIMFVDLVGFTRLSESGGPMLVVELLNRYFASVGDLISKAGGEVIKYIGDGIMAYFGSAEEAIQAARGILTGRRRLNLELASAGIGSINLRVGVAWGPALLCHVGPPHHKDRTLLGDTVNTAARLESNARPGTALLDARLLRGRRPEDLGLALLRDTLSVKGKERRLQVMTFVEDADAYST